MFLVPYSDNHVDKMVRRGGIPASFPMLVDLGLKNEANRTGALVSTRVRLVITPVFTSSDIPQSV